VLASGCVQLAAAVADSSCFSRDELGGLLPAPVAERVLLSLGVSPACLEWASEFESQVQACQEVLEGTSCPEACAVAISTSALRRSVCDVRDLALLPNDFIDLDYEFAASIADHCEGTCASVSRPEILSAAEECRAGIESGETCPAACPVLLGAVESSSCVPVVLLNSFAPQFLGAVADACNLVKVCEAEVAAAVPAAGECFSELSLLPPGAATCVPSCITAAKVVTQSVCLPTIATFLRAQSDREDVLAKSPWATSRSIGTFEALAKSLAYSALLRLYSSTLVASGSLCSDTCMELTSNVAEACEDDILAGSCDSACYEAQEEALETCLGIVVISEEERMAVALKALEAKEEVLSALPSLEEIVAWALSLAYATSPTVALIAGFRDWQSAQLEKRRQLSGPGTGPRGSATAPTALRRHLADLADVESVGVTGASVACQVACRGSQPGELAAICTAEETRCSYLCLSSLDELLSEEKAQQCAAAFTQLDLYTAPTLAAIDEAYAVQEARAKCRTLSAAHCTKPCDSALKDLASSPCLPAMQELLADEFALAYQSCRSFEEDGVPYSRAPNPDEGRRLSSTGAGRPSLLF